MQRNVKAFLRFLGVLILVLGIWCMGSGVAEQTVKAPDITAPVYILAGQDLSFTVNTVEGAQAYSVVVYDYKGPADELYHSDRAGTHTLTSLASNTIYRLTANARFEGDVYMYTSYDVIVLDQEPSDTEITFLTSKTEVQPSEAFGIAAIAPGAAQLVLYNGNEEYTFNHKDTQGNLYLTTGWSYDKPYTGEVYVKAYYPDGTTRKSSHIQMNCQTQGSVDCGALSIPVSVTQGNALTFTVPSASNLADIESSGSSVIYYVKVDDRNTEERICDLRLKKADGVYKCYSWSDAIIDWQEQDNAQPFQVTVAADKLSEGHIYDVSVEASAKGWNTAYVDSSTIVTAGQSAQTVTLLVNGASDDFETTSNTDFTVTVDAPGATAVRLRNDYEWLYFDSRNHPAHVEEVMAFGKGTSSIFAQACYEEYDPDQVDWDTLNWTGTSNVIRITATTPSGRLAKAQFEAESLTVARGQDLILHITKLGLPSEWYWADIARQEVNEKDELYWRWDIGNSGHWDWDKEASCLTIPTYELEPGLYWANVAVDAAGYDPTWTALFFTVTDPGEQAMDFDFRVTSTSIYTHDNIKVTVYVEGAEETGLEVVKEGDPNWRDMRLDGGALNIWDWSTDQNGIYYMTPVGHCYTLDEQGNVVYGEDGEPVWTERRGDSIQITVSTEGQLEPAEITGVPMLMETGSALQAACADVEGAEWYEWSLTYCSDTEDWQDLMYKHMDASQENVIQLPLDGSYFSREGRYRINVSVGARHKDSSYAEKFFYVSETIDQSLELTLQGADASVTDWPAHRNMHFQVRADGASAVRFMKPDGNWEYRHGSARDDFGFLTYDINPDPGTVQVMVQAAYDGYRDWLAEDFDWDSFDWDQFDWNAQGYTWSKTSNVITVSVVSQGPANAAEFTVPESVIRGEVLTITIHGAGEGAARATAFSANIDDREGIYIDGVTDFPVVLTLPTGDLEAGEYTVDIGAVCEGHDWTGSTATFRVTEPEEADPFIFSIAEPVIDRTNFAISAYEPDASWIGLWVRDKQNGSDFNEYGRYPGNYMNASSLNWNGGEYEVYAEAHYEDENGDEIRAPRESEHKTVTVAFLGSLDKPVILLNSASLNAGEDLDFQVEGLDQGADFWWDVQVKDLESGSDGSEMTTVARWTADDGAVPQSFTVSRDVLAAGHGYQISAWVDRNGYRGAGSNAGFVVMSPDNTPLELTLQGQTGNITDWPANKHMHFRLSAEGASAVRFMRADGSWDYRDGRSLDESGYFTYDMDPEAGPIQVVAQAAYDGYRDWLADDFDWGQFDWGSFDWNAQGYTWSRTSNSITVSVVSQGPANAAEFTVPESVIRGELLAITINGAGEGAAVPTAFSVNIHDRDGVYTDGVTDFPVVLTLPTGDLEAGEYTVEISATREGYDWTTSSATLLVTEPSEAEPFIFSIPEPLIADTEFAISAYEPNASWIRLKVWDKQNSSGFEDYGDYPGNNMNLFTNWPEGEYEVYAEAHYEDENGNVVRQPRESEHRTVTVVSLGSLSDPVITMDSDVIYTGENLTFEVEGLDTVSGCRWSVTVEDQDSRNAQGNLVRVAEWTQSDGVPPESFTVSSDLLTPNHLYSIKSNVEKNGYGHAYAEKHFTVLVQSSGEPLELIASASGDLTAWPQGEYLSFSLKADGASAVRFMGFDGNWQYMDGKNQQWDGYFSYGGNPEKGEYTILAQAAYDGFRDWLADDFDWSTFDWNTFDWNAQGYTWEATSNIIHVSVVSLGTLDAPVYSIEKTDVTRGEPFVIHITGQDRNEWYSARFDNDQGEEVYEYSSWDSMAGIMTVETTDYMSGTYSMTLSSIASGYDGASADPVTVTIREPEENEIVFYAPETALIGENHPVRVYAPGALRIGYGIDGKAQHLDENGNYIGWDTGETWSTSNWFTMDDVGEHTLTAYVQYADGGDWVTVDRQVNVIGYGKLVLDTSVIPDMYSAGDIYASLSVHMPEHAEHKDVTICEVWNDSDGFHSETLVSTSDVDTWITIPVNTVRGHKITLSVNASARGYESLSFYTEIPVVAPQGTDAELIMNAEDTTRIPVSQDIEFVVHPAEGKTISAVRFYNGYGFWEDGNEITPENHSDWFNAEGDFSVWNSYCDETNPERDYTVFAEVLLEGSNAWMRTNEFHFSTYVDAYVGDFGFADASSITVERGEMVTVAFTSAENATRYWVNISGFHPPMVSEGTTVTFSTADLMPGYYSLEGHAGAGAGVVPKTSWNMGELIITEPSDTEMVIRTSKDTVEISEEFTISVYAPGATRIKVAHMDEENVWWDSEGDSLSANGMLNDGIGEQTFYVSAMYDGSWSTPETVRIMLVANGELLPPEVSFSSTQIAQGQDFTFHVVMPEGAEYYSVWANRTEDGSSVYDGRDFYEDQDITISCSHLAVNESFTLTVRSNARGMQPGYFNATIRVVDGTPPQAGTPTFVLPAALREIGEQAFEGISAEVVKVSDTVESIGNRAFAYSSIGQVILPASLVSIADDAFEGCSMLVFAPEGSYAWNWAVNHGFDVIGH